MTRFLAYGEAMLRLSTRPGERLDEAETLSVHPAGSELNVAVALAALGCEVSWASTLPDSPLGRRVAGAAVAAGVDVSAVVWSEGARLGTFYAELGSAPRRTAVVYDRAGSAFALDPSPPGSLDGIEWAIVSGVTPALGSAAREATARLVESARDAGARLCFDLNYRERLWSPEEAAASARPLLAVAGLAVCGERDARLVLGLEGGPEEILAGLRELAPEAEAVVLTRGAAGSLAAIGGETVSHPGFEAEVVDPIGAGDAFLAGLLWSLDQGKPAAVALARAAALGALACTVDGDFARFSPVEVATVIAGEMEPDR